MYMFFFKYAPGSREIVWIKLVDIGWLPDPGRVLTGIRSLFPPVFWSGPVLVSPRTPHSRKNIWWSCRQMCARGPRATRWKSRRNYPRLSPPRLRCCCSLRIARTTTRMWTKTTRTKTTKTCSPVPGPCNWACCPAVPHPARTSVDCCGGDGDCGCWDFWSIAAAIRRPSFSSTRPTLRTAPAALRTSVQPFCSSYPA